MRLGKASALFPGVAILVQPTPSRRNTQLSRIHKYGSSILLALALLSPLLINGCAARASYLVYDPGYQDYHVWDAHEGAYYQRWESETHRDHRNFKKRDAGEQKEYWTWRHNHPDEKH